MYIGGIFLFGCSGALLYKALFLLQVQTSDNGEYEQFNHPYIITLLFYVSQFCNVFLVLYDSIRKRKHQQVEKTESNFNITTLLTFFGVSMVDVIGSTLYNLSVSYGLLSIIQMIRNCTTLFVAMFNAIFFKQFRQDWHLQQTIGIITLTIGLIAISIISMFYDDEQSSASNNTLGIILCILSCLFSGIVFTIEEFIFRNVNMTGMQVVTSEGVWGVFIYICIIFTINYNYQNGVPIDSMETFNYQFTHYWEVPFYIFTYMLSTIFYGCSSLQVTKYVNAVTRSMMDACKTLLVWIFSLIFGWEQLNAVSTPLKFLLYCIVVFGTLLYNNVIRFKCLQPQYVRIQDSEEK